MTREFGDFPLSAEDRTAAMNALELAGRLRNALKEHLRAPDQHPNPLKEGVDPVGVLDEAACQVGEIMAILEVDDRMRQFSEATGDNPH